MADSFRVPVPEIRGKSVSEPPKLGFRAVLERVELEQGLAASLPLDGLRMPGAERTKVPDRARTTPPGYLEHLINSCSAAIIGIALDGVIVSWNLGAESLYGYTAVEMTGKALATLYSPHRPLELLEQLQMLREGQATTHYETVHCHKNGCRLEVLLSISPIKDTVGTLIGASVVAQNLTQRREDEQERLQLIQELTSALTRTGRAALGLSKD